MPEKQNLTRRDFFIQTGLAAVVAPPLLHRTSAAGADTTGSIRNNHPSMAYREIPGTGIHLSLLSLGGSGLKKNVAHYAIDHGINLIHMSASYSGGQCIAELGSVLKSRRNQVYIALKDNFTDIDNVLKTLQTDHIDFLMFNRHAREEVDDSAIYERFHHYRKAGKVRFAGLTTHNDVKACVAKALDTDFYKLLMPVMNQPAFDAMARELITAEKKKVVIMAMKTMKGIHDQDLRLAFFKKLASHPAVTTVIKGFSSFAEMDRFLSAVKESLTSEEDMSLYRHAGENRSRNCMMCGTCQRLCPRHVEIPALLRAAHYYHAEQHRPDLAVDVFRSVPVHRRPDRTCLQCRQCEQVCPNGISIARELKKITTLFKVYRV